MYAYRDMLRASLVEGQAALEQSEEAVGNATAHVERLRRTRDRLVEALDEDEVEIVDERMVDRGDRSKRSRT